MSEGCKRHFIQDHCFYECSPNIRPWVVKVCTDTVVFSMSYQLGAGGVIMSHSLIWEHLKMQSQARHGVCYGVMGYGQDL
jgi:hypothetical protein